MEQTLSENPHCVSQVYISYIHIVLSHLENTFSKIYLFLVIKNPAFEQINNLNGI